MFFGAVRACNDYWSPVQYISLRFQLLQDEFNELSAGVWEAAEVRTILEALQRVPTRAPSHVFADAVVSQEDRAVLLDIGANIGIFSFVAAVLGYTVYSFEAMPRNVAALHQTLCWNPGLRDTLTVSPPV